MSGVENVEPFGDGFIAALCPELIIFAGLILLISMIIYFIIDNFNYQGRPAIRT